jgi:hypothetical protein
MRFLTLKGITRAETPRPQRKPNSCKFPIINRVDDSVVHLLDFTLSSLRLCARLLFQVLALCNITETL